MINTEKLTEFVTVSQREIDGGALEDKLRHLLSAYLTTIFPDSPWWIQEHVLGTETHVHFANDDGKKRYGFADSVVGKTAIEYEKNLNIKSIFDEGYHQVREYCAALYNLGINENEILGILSDTVRWYGYSIEVTKEKKETYGAKDITLIQEEYIDLSSASQNEIQKFEKFVEKYLGREASRLLTAKSLVLDFGVESVFYNRHIDLFQNAVGKAMTEKSDYAELIKSVWQSFVAYLGVSEYGNFSTDTYVNEFYLVTVAKVLCANILAAKPLISSEREMLSILNGDYFAQRNIRNLVDYDYFGWLNNSPYASLIVPAVKEIQELLLSYDFGNVGTEDIFGELLAQLANREHRLLLGQEYTPHWVARDMVRSTFEELDDKPRLLDMCCGSGVFLIEGIKETRSKYKITNELYDLSKDELIFSCAMGFDIDPLAVMLAKVNWIMVMKDLFPLHSGEITIPIYHADSLFVATPITHKMPGEGDDAYVLHFENKSVSLPWFMLTPDYRQLFDSFMAKCYAVAMSRAVEMPNENSYNAEELIKLIITELNLDIDNTKEQKLIISANELVKQLETLQREGKNGIWFFILSNSYRPGLITNQFNCIVSNPPWMAMSKLADNPYKTELLSKAELYGIKPPGASHLHMELATIFLLRSLDTYLQDGARWMCIMPGSLLSGFNHEPLRKSKYKEAPHTVNISVDTIWELPRALFKNKAVVLGGSKGTDSYSGTLLGREYEAEDKFVQCGYSLNIQGNRSAWTNRGSSIEVAELINSEPLVFNQGADVFPRTALFHEYTRQPNGNWDVRPIDKTSDLYYLISESKKELCNDLSVDGLEDRFLFDCLISKHLSPFFVAKPAKALIPGKKQENGWTALFSSDIALMNSSTAFIFKEIQDKTELSLETLLVDKINIRGKLMKQNYNEIDWLVLSNAGGSNPCAAFLDMRDVNKEKLIIDQTLYWYAAENEEEAFYLTGLLNSPALAEAIMDFQPQGEFGRRHIHTLPYKVMPRFDINNPAHLDVIRCVNQLKKDWDDICSVDSKIGNLLNPNSGTLNSRRRKQQDALKNLKSFNEYKKACDIVMGV